ncbi:putative S-adenosylmethionine-dependent methyltransferase/MSMEI_2290 [Zhongshania aliphaticivorans]|uniref:Putative S-adenosylmethionine-dependent methyltransferase/MSMEI_2290 n=1 Tax=Zhongshania aliphaticivorans TaxID=1470434 RepID=A0A5S9PM43_9GAMM|nr:class I SAM-dependent methyltransferase [Zhongshania aliphaticivorans]CAA0104993.1 putative S-adenosylmethionine-dependent methyltransferase/MSMEI_2290 [Zhongshania aliphaticivorans]CAA0105295.1 putative S-adenosylmethionine-dependent methyltransferase/MSMEI_2290 [Zhongshania aliphaticivorans]
MACPICQSTKSSLAGSKHGHKLYRCADCSLLYVSPAPVDGELIHYYQDYHKTSQYIRKIKSKQRRAKKRIWSLQRLTLGKKFIDVGCNEGYAVAAARSLGLEACGIDVNEASIGLAHQQYPMGDFRATNAQALATTDERFDIIYCSDVIEQLSDPHSFIAALYTLLNKGGVLFLTTPDIGHFSVQKNLLDWTAVRPPEHLLYFSKAPLQQLLEMHQFNQISFRPNLKPTLKLIARK